MPPAQENTNQNGTSPLIPGMQTPVNSLPVAETPAPETINQLNPNSTKPKKALAIIPGKEVILGFIFGLTVAIAIIMLFLNFSILPSIAGAFVTSVNEARTQLLTKYDLDGNGQISEEEALNLFTEESNNTTSVITENKDGDNTTTTVTNQNSNLNVTNITDITELANITNIEGDIRLGDVYATSLNIYNSYLDNYGNLYIGGNSYFAGDVTIEENIDVLGDSHFHENVTIDENIYVDGDGTIDGDLIVEGDSYLKGDYAQIGEPNPGPGAEFIVYLPTEFQGDVTFTEDVTFTQNVTLGDTVIDGSVTTNVQINSPLFCDENGENCFTAEDLQSIETTEILRTSLSYDGNFSYTGGLVGYQAANAICAAEYEESHFCRTDEIIHVIASEGTDDFTGTGWIAEGPPGFTAESNDCTGYKSASSTKLGAFWLYESNGGGSGWLVNCSTSRPISCCR